MAGVCGQCGVSASVMKRCSRCMGILYCSRDCQGKHWPSHKLHCENCNSVQAHHESMGAAELQNNIKECSRAEKHISQPESYIMIRIKHKLMKHELKIPKSTNGEESFGFVCNQLKIPPTNLRLVSRGKLISKDNILSFLENGAVFQAFGEEAEDETGLDMRDIDVLMAQLSVDRNVAVRALRKTGDLVDAILYVSDNM